MCPVQWLVLTLSPPREGYERHDHTAQPRPVPPAGPACHLIWADATRHALPPSSWQARNPCEWVPGLGWRSHGEATPGEQPRRGARELGTSRAGPPPPTAISASAEGNNSRTDIGRHRRIPCPQGWLWTPTIEDLLVTDTGFFSTSARIPRNRETFRPPGETKRRGDADTGRK
jgi:hypothetical protein